MAAHQLHFLHKTEGACTCNFVQIRLSGKINGKGLLAAVKHRVIKSDGEGDFKAVIRLETHPFIRLAHFHRRFNAQKALFGGLVNNARILQQIHKRQAGAVHNRNFRRVQFNQNIVDAVGSQCRHNVFNGAHTHAVFGYHGGRQAGVVNQIRAKRNDLALLTSKIGAAK